MNKNCMNNEDDMLNQEKLGEAIVNYWNEICEEEVEGKEGLFKLKEELSKISKNSIVKKERSDSLEKLIKSIGNLDMTRRTSKDLNKALENTISLIQWYPNNVYKDLLEAEKCGNYCANIIGKERDSQNNTFLFYNGKVIVGLFLLGPNAFYPEHNHPAVERWVVLSGTAKWKRGGEDWRIRKPGEYFLHNEYQSHAMKTMDEPLFALWAWTGNLDEWAKWIEEDK